MNTYTTSPTMALGMARYHATGPSAQTEVRATLRAIRAQKRAERTHSWNPFAFVSRKRGHLQVPVVRVAH